MDFSDFLLLHFYPIKSQRKKTVPVPGEFFPVRTWMVSGFRRRERLSHVKFNMAQSDRSQGAKRKNTYNGTINFGMIWDGTFWLPFLRKLYIYIYISSEIF